MNRCECGREIVQPERGRKRRKCTTCSPPDSRDRRQPIVKLPRSIPMAGIVNSTRVELEAAGRLESADGAVAMHLAGLLESGDYNAQGAAALARAHAESLGRAVKSADPAGSVVDELRRRRANRHAG